jgi:CRP-like cAMP-binding protein
MIDDLKTVMLFSRLDDNQLQRVTQKARRVQLKSTEILFEQGEPAERFYMLDSGLIKLYRLSPAGNEKVIEVIRPGSTFAEALVFIESAHYPVGAQCLKNSELISFDARDFASMLRESIDTCFLLMADMSQRLRGMIREIDDMSLHNAACRVAGYLHTRVPISVNSFKLEIPKQTLASRLSIKPETFSRIIKNFNDRNVLTLDGNTVHIHDREELKTLADTCAIPADLLEATFMV